MSDKRSATPDSRTQIGNPFNFQHTTHVYKESAKSCYKGVPSTWRGSFALHSFSQDNSAVNINDEDFLNILKGRPLTTYHSKRQRIELISEENAYDYQQLTNFVDERVIYESPIISIYNLSVIYDYGLYGIIYGYKKSSSELFCFKFYRLTPQTNTRNIKEELQFHINHSHPNIVDFVEAHVCSFSVFLTFKTFNEIPLSDAISFIFGPNMSRDDQRYVIESIRYDIDIVAYIVHSIATGLNYVHKNGYIHGDIKSDNVIILEDGSIKISEFGICRKVSKELIAKEVFGTPYWMAPEIAKGERYGTEVDIWSLGCVLVELIKGEPPLFYLEPSHAIQTLKSQKVVPFITANVDRLSSPLLGPFIESCMALERIQRASAVNLLIHPFLQKRATSQDLKPLLALLGSISQI